MNAVLPTSAGAGATVSTGPDELADWLGGWDALAAACRTPYAAPAWGLAWWRRIAPRSARLRVLLVHDGPRLVGVAPFVADAWPAGLTRYRLLGSGAGAPVGPVAERGAEPRVARETLEWLADADPPVDLLTLEGVEHPWDELLGERSEAGWAIAHEDRVAAIPSTTIEGSTFQAWMAGRTRNFRQQMRRARRRLEREGARSRQVDAGELEPALRAMLRLHAARWGRRGGSTALRPGIGRMLLDAGRALPPDRFRLWTTEVRGRPISTHLFVAAGGAVTYWLGGFDDAWAADHPGLVTILAALEDACDRGDRTFDLGWGAHGYKERIADDHRTVRWLTAVPRGRRTLLAAASIAPRTVIRAAGRWAPEDVRRRVARLARA